MRRRLLNLLTVLSLLLCLATVLLWVRSHSAHDTFVYLSPRSPGLPFAETHIWFSVDYGVMHFHWRRHLYTRQAPTQELAWMREQNARGWSRYSGYAHGSPTADNAPLLRRLGLMLSTEPGRHVAGTAYPRLRVLVPFWLLCPLLAVLPGAAAARLARRGEKWARRRIRRGHAGHDLCASCGYDLRASTSRCPECGTARNV